MRVFDLKRLKSHSYEERDKNVFFETSEFKMRIIELPQDGKIPSCSMSSYVIFYVLNGSVDVSVNRETISLEEGNCLVTEPATLSMSTTGGARILGIQIAKHNP